VTERDRRALTLGVAAVLGAVLLLRVAPWGVRRVLGAETSLRERAVLLARARADLADASVLRDSAAQLSQLLVGLAPKILSGNSTADAVADLSARVNMAVSAHQTKLERVDPMPDSTVAGRLHRVTLRAVFEGDVRGLAGVLEALQVGKIALVLREVRVTAVDTGSRDKMPEVLRVEMTVAGWYLGERDTGNGRQGAAHQ